MARAKQKKPKKPLAKPAKHNRTLTKAGETSISTGNLETERKAILKHARKFVRPLVPTKKRFITLTIALLAGMVVLITIVFGVLIYQFKSDSSLVYRVARLIPYPAAKVDGNYVSYGNYLFHLNPLKHYYKNSAGQGGDTSATIDFSTEEGKTKLAELQRLALREAEETVIISELAEEKDISITKQELDEAVKEAIEREGGEDKFNEAIQFFYGWDEGDFRRVMKTQLLQRKLQPVFSPEQKQKSESVLARVRGGEDFAKVATEVSGDPGSKDKGGDLGFTSKGAYVPEFEEAAYKLEVGQISDIIETQFGFHIIKLLEKKDEEIRVAHILIQYADTQGTIDERLAKAGKKSYIKVTPAEADATVQSESSAGDPNQGAAQ